MGIEVFFIEQSEEKEEARRKEEKITRMSGFWKKFKKFDASRQKFNES